MNEITRPRPWTILAAVALSGLGAAGAFLLAVAHLGVELPGLSALGPTGRAVLPAAVGFAVAALLLGGLTWGLLAGKRWAWPAGTGLALLGILSGIGQFRGVASAVGLAVMLALLVLLVTPSARDFLASPRS